MELSIFVARVRNGFKILKWRNYNRTLIPQAKCILFTLGKSPYRFPTISYLNSPYFKAFRLSCSNKRHCRFVQLWLSSDFYKLRFFDNLVITYLFLFWLKNKATVAILKDDRSKYSFIALDCCYSRQHIALRLTQFHRKHD